MYGLLERDRPRIDYEYYDIVSALFDVSDNPSSKKLFDLYFFDGFSVERVAEKCNYSVRHVERLKNLILLCLFQRALKKLKKITL